MSEKVQALRESLRQLHSELEAVDSLDSESLALVEQLIGELHALLEPAEAPESDAHQSLLDRLAEASRRFEASHPVLGPPLERVINALSNLGI